MWSEAQPLRLGNIAAGDYTVFILEFTVEGLARPASRVRIAQVSLEGSVPGLGKRQEFAPQDLFVTFTTDEAAVAAVDPEVLGYVQQKNVDNLMQKAMGQATVNAGQARQTLQVALGMTQRIGNPAMTKILSNALDELNKTGTYFGRHAQDGGLGGSHQDGAREDRQRCASWKACRPKRKSARSLVPECFDPGSAVAMR